MSVSIASIVELKKLTGKFGTTRGLLMLGSQDGLETGSTKAIRVDANGRMEVSVVGATSRVTNPQTDDDSLPEGESHESDIVLSHGFYTVGNIWMRLQVNSSGYLFVATA